MHNLLFYSLSSSYLNLQANKLTQCFMKLALNQKIVGTIVTQNLSVYRRVDIQHFAMESDLSDVQILIENIQSLFQNKQLDQFITQVETHILPFLLKEQHLVSDHLLQKQKAHLSQLQSKNNQQKPSSTETCSLQKIQKPMQHKVEQKLQQENTSKNKQISFVNQQISNKSQGSGLKSKNSEDLQSQGRSKNKAKQIENALKQSKINILQKYEQVKLLLFKIERQMKKLQTPMTDKSEWKINKINSTSSLGVKTKGTLIELRYQGIVETNIFNLCVMIYLSQLWKQWVPFCTNSKTITQPSQLQKVVLMDFKIPFLTQRYTYLHGVAIDRITKNGKLYIYAEGISHQKDLVIQVHKADKAEYEKKTSKSIVLDAKFMVCEIGNQGNGKYQVKVYGMLDSHMPLLPQKIVNYIVKQLGGMIFNKIVQRAKDIKNTPWEKQLKQNQKREVKNKFYEWLQLRIANWDKTQVARKSKI